MVRVAERFFWWLARKLPPQLVYFAAIRVWSFATTGLYGSTVVTDLTIDEATRRWSRGHCLEGYGEGC